MYLISKLRLWAIETFGASKPQKKSLLAELNNLDTIGESKLLSHLESTRLTQIRFELFSILNQEEIYWK